MPHLLSTWINDKCSCWWIRISVLYVDFNVLNKCFDSYSSLSCFLISAEFSSSRSTCFQMDVLRFCLGYSDSSYSAVFSYSASCHETKIYFLFIKSFLFPWGIILFTFFLFFCPFFQVLFDNLFKGSNILCNAVVNHHWIYYYSANYSSSMKHWKNGNHTNSVQSME